MTEKHYIAGKDAALEDSIAKMQKQLQNLGFDIQEHAWLNPVPHVWSVHINDSSCPLLFTNGKGGSKQAALASALGEYFERLATNYFWADFYLGDNLLTQNFAHYPNEQWFPAQESSDWPEALLSKELLDFYNPSGQLQLAQLVDLNTANYEKGICTLPFKRQRDGKECLFPVNIIGNLYVSNGMSAGNSQAEARVQALSEILERFIKFKIIEEGICLPDVPQQVLEKYPDILEGIRKLEEKGFSVLVKDASLGGQFPVMNVTLLSPENQGCFASFGAHPKFFVALERSLTELLQGRELAALNEFPAPIHNLDEVASPENIETHFIDSSGLMGWSFFSDTSDYDYSPCDFEGTTNEEFIWLCELIEQTGRDIYIADYEHLGVPCCRILVPSMSEIYASEDLEWANNNVGIGLRNQILQLDALSAEDAQTLADEIDEMALDDMQPVGALIGLPLQPNTLWKDFRVAELKVLLVAISQNKDALLEGCEWLIDFSQIEEKRYKLYHCVVNRLECDDDPQYHSTMEKLYSKEIMREADQLLSGSLPSWWSTENTWQDALIEAYQKVQKAKYQS
ncbi:MAG: 30s ribosomal protein S12 methylthiotransferase accessory protein YcaO [uncultured Thiotrichaceae bacterium]|uniref:30s ribosomal protein S12 methylthiotransferase accessory protein YcaO n=1 Tax=uncultured Thiotrichaceae bacterium TaxID=298394 RepID=A0A6S6TWD8_9GAMM|nr:MAG: 30s ribosomal protein S12 methylthiotransferase accessory protein YcaO [uncultured Thiotrichaceae bacterium]